MIRHTVNVCRIVSHGYHCSLFRNSCIRSLSVRPTTGSDTLHAQMEAALTESEREVTTKKVLTLPDDLPVWIRVAKCFLL
ncbi:hypothetical protein CGRA01v4_14731 [Colletotrichum graminicola]|nr:hypothetical protein CGRA01v4_14731 [Colletotrichum graminicola]